MILLLLRNNLIHLHQSSNFVQSLLNHPKFEIILLGITACPFLFAGASASATDISLSDYLYISSKALFIIFKDPKLSDNASISFILYELVLSSCELCHTCFILYSGGSFA